MNQDKDSRHFTTIAISNENYRILKRYGEFGESFNDIVSKILNHSKPQKKGGNELVPRLVNAEENANKFFCFRTALQELEAERFKDKVLKP